MNPTTATRNPGPSPEAIALTNHLVAARSEAIEEQLAAEAGLTLGQARALALTVALEREDDGVRRLLARDLEFRQFFPAIEAKLREYAREETPALCRFTAREILVLVEEAAARAARIAAAAASIAAQPTTRRSA